MKQTNDLSERTLTIERTFDAPLKLVWQAWTQAEHIANWWGPKGMALTVVEHDFQVGGNWKYSMPMPDGNEFITDGTYQEIVEMEKIVTTANFRPMTEGVELHITFAAEGNRTHFTFAVVHPSADYARQQEKMGFFNGWGSTLDRLEEFLSVPQ